MSGHNLFPQNLKAVHAPSHQTGCRLGRERGKAILNISVKEEKLTLQHLPWWGIQRSACLKSIWAKFLCNFPSNLQCCCPPKMREQRGREREQDCAEHSAAESETEAAEWSTRLLINSACFQSRCRSSKEAVDGGGRWGWERGGKKRAEREESLPRIAADACKNGSFIRGSQHSQNCWVPCLQRCICMHGKGWCWQTGVCGKADGKSDRTKCYQIHHRGRNTWAGKQKD